MLSLQKIGQSQAAQTSDPEVDSGVPTPAQVRLALEVLRSPGSAQGRSYEARCELAGRSDCKNFPLHRSSASEHARIMHAVAAVLWDQARPDFQPLVLVVGASALCLHRIGSSSRIARPLAGPRTALLHF